MLVCQMLIAALNPPRQGSRVYGVLFPSKDPNNYADTMFSLNDTCSFAVPKLKDFISEFFQCKSQGVNDYTWTDEFQNVCGRSTVTEAALIKILKTAKDSQVSKKAMITLSDGTIDDPDGKSSDSLKDLEKAGVTTMVAGRITSAQDPSLTEYARPDSNKNNLYSDSPITLGIAIVDRLNAEGVFCDEQGI